MYTILVIKAMNEPFGLIDIVLRTCGGTTPMKGESYRTYRVVRDWNESLNIISNKYGEDYNIYMSINKNKNRREIVIDDK